MWQVWFADHLRQTSPAAQRAQVLADIKFAPAWVHAHFRLLAKPPPS